MSMPNRLPKPSPRGRYRSKSGLMFRPLQFDSLIYGSAERSFCICKIKIKIFIFIFITAPIKHFNDRPKKLQVVKKLARSRSVCRFYDVAGYLVSCMWPCQTESCTLCLSLFHFRSSPHLLSNVYYGH